MNSPKFIWIKPATTAEGNPLVVRDPGTMAALDPEGERKEQSSHWTRRIKAGDVVVFDPAAKSTAKPAAKPAAKE